MGLSLLLNTKGVLCSGKVSIAAHSSSAVSALERKNDDLFYRRGPWALRKRHGQGTLYASDPWVVELSLQ